MKKLILASGSPRRKQLLEQIGINFIVDPSSIEEVFPEKALPAEVVKILALRKAQERASRYADGTVIGADTVVVINELILGKPRDKEEAFSMLSKLQGNKHQVYTGVAVVNAQNLSYDVFYECTQVYFRSLTNEEISGYIQSGEPYGKAGAYGIQGLGAVFIDKIEGCYYNVVGLPLNKLYPVLKKYGVDLFQGGDL